MPLTHLVQRWIRSVRVIAGEIGGRQLKAPKGNDTRPTTDRVKESLFSIINPRIAGARILDLFAGTGGLAIEALSRGAASAVLVDHSAAAIKVINENIELTGLKEKARVYKGDFSKSCSAMGRKNYSFDIIFLDPPYERGFDTLALKQIHINHLLADDGLIVVEHSSREEVGIPQGVLYQNIRTERYGETSLSFLVEVVR